MTGAKLSYVCLYMKRFYCVYGYMLFLFAVSCYCSSGSFVLCIKHIAKGQGSPGQRHQQRKKTPKDQFHGTTQMPPPIGQHTHTDIHDGLTV